MGTNDLTVNRYHSDETIRSVNEFSRNQWSFDFQIIYPEFIRQKLEDKKQSSYSLSDCRIIFCYYNYLRYFLLYLL